MPARLGPALSSTDEELQDAARITTADLARVRGWLAVYGPRVAPLIEAEPYERQFLPIPLILGFLAGGARYLWLTQDGLYYDLRRRRTLDPEAVRREVDRALGRAAQEARVFTGGMIGPGGASLAEWELGMRERIKNAVSGATFTASGGERRTHLAALEAMQDRVAAQYQYLRRYAQQIESGKQPVDGRAGARSALYVHTARTEHMRARQAVARSVGYDQVRNVLVPGDNCNSVPGGRPGCIEETRRGWAPIGDMSLPGERTCIGNCRCSTQYRNSQTGEVYGEGGPFPEAGAA